MIPPRLFGFWEKEDAPFTPALPVGFWLLEEGSMFSLHACPPSAFLVVGRREDAPLTPALPVVFLWPGEGGCSLHACLVVGRRRMLLSRLPSQWVFGCQKEDGPSTPALPVGFGLPSQWVFGYQEKGTVPVQSWCERAGVDVS